MPVILIHGAGGTHQNWLGVFRRLEGCRSYGLDLPGHGRSEGAGRQSIGEYVQAVRTWMQAAGLRQAVFVGHSMGSAIALQLALEAPEAVLGLGLVGSAPRLRVNRILLDKVANPKTYIEALELLTTWSYAPDTPPSFLGLAALNVAETPQPVFYGDLRACDAFDFTERMREVQQPTLVICGAHDRMTPVGQARILAASIPNARIEVIAEAGHMVMIERPFEVAAALVGFTYKITRPG